jgi:hypothetical protein
MNMELESELLVKNSENADSIQIATEQPSISAWNDEERDGIPSRPSEWTEAKEWTDAKAFPLEQSRIESSNARSPPAQAWSSTEESHQIDSFQQRGASAASGHMTRSQKKLAVPAEQTETVSLTSLHAASMYGDEDMVLQLVSESACAARDSAGFTPLHFAACYGHGGVLRVLLEARGDANAESVHGWTPLHLAARNGHVDCLRALLHAGPQRALALRCVAPPTPPSQALGLTVQRPAAPHAPRF